MSVSTSGNWETRITGSDTNGGGFDYGVNGMLTDGAATVANTSSPVFTSASYNFINTDVNAWIFIKTGTNWNSGWYQISSVSNNAATLLAGIGQACSLGILSPNTTVGCASVASPTSATWSIDYSQQGTAQITYIDLASSIAGNAITSAGNPFGKQMVGNVLNVTGGTNFTTGRYVITATSGSSGLTDRAVVTAAGSAGSGYLGGAFVSPGMAWSVAVVGNSHFIQSGTPAYIIGSATTNVTSGCISMGAGTNSATASRIIGYQTTRGDGGTKPILRCLNISSPTIITTSAGNIVDNLELDGNSITSSRGISATTSLITRCIGRNFANNAFAGAGSPPTLWFNCEATGCKTSTALSGGNAQFCISHDNSIAGITINQAYNCISSNNNGAGFTVNGVQGTLINCTADNNFTYGYTIVGGTGIMASLINCLATNNASGAFNAGNLCANTKLINCAIYNNGTPGGVPQISANLPNQTNCITLLGDPYINRNGANYNINSNLGNTVKLGGVPTATGVWQYPYLGIPVYYDIGALPHNIPTPPRFRLGDGH